MTADELYELTINEANGLLQDSDGRQDFYTAMRGMPLAVFCPEGSQLSGEVQRFTERNLANDTRYDGTNAFVQGDQIPDTVHGVKGAFHILSFLRMDYVPEEGEEDYIRLGTVQGGSAAGAEFRRV